MFESEFLTAATSRTYRNVMSAAIELLCRALPAQPYRGEDPARLASLFDGEVLPETSGGLDNLWGRVEKVISNSVTVTHPNTIAHLHCPPLIVAQAAELVISALNQSMDSFDQAPAATVLEEKVVAWLCRQVGLGTQADGVFTSGGTQSNHMGLLLARDCCVQKNWNHSVQSQGLPAQAHRLRILCSDVAHFTVEKSAAQLGLGTQAVVRIPTDESFRLRPEMVSSALKELRRNNLIPMAIVGTAGTTDFGSIDPLSEIAPLARDAAAWFHVDAAYGSALLFSARHRDLLKGIESADSISVDFHKLFWQPISCAAFLLRDRSQFQYVKMNADYLNPEVHEEMGIPNLVTRSFATTRRFDALKPWVSFQALGRKKLAQMIDATIDLASHAAIFIRNHEQLELINEPVLGCVVFRYRPASTAIEPNALNAQLRQRLFEEGLAVVGHTIVRGRQCLKLTCMNPTVSRAQTEDLLRLIVKQGKQMEQDYFRS